MASFNTAYGLCSLIDQRGLLGVASDEEGCAVITLGKNIVIRCRLSDQKQISSWSSILKLSSKVVYNSMSEKYIGVFDEIHIKQWTKSETSIEKLKKHRLSNPIQEIIIHKNEESQELVVLFRNGATMALDLAVKENKTPVSGFIPETAAILNAKIITHEEQDCLIVLAKEKNKCSICYSVYLEPETYEILPNTMHLVKLRREVKMLGHCIMEHHDKNSLITLWSDGFLYSLPLPLESTQKTVGKFTGTLSTISHKSEVAMTQVSKTHVAIYAGDASEEGAVLLIHNLDFSLSQAQTKFKMFNKPPQMWGVENRLLIVMGQRLVCVPHNIRGEALSDLVGSRPLEGTVEDEIMSVVPVGSWGEEVEAPKAEDDAPFSLKEKIDVMTSEGWSEFSICQSLLNQLIDSGDLPALSWCLDHFLDVPEDLLVRLSVLALTQPESSFESPSNDSAKSKNASKKRRKSKTPEKPKINGDTNEYPVNPLTPSARSDFLDKVLSVPISDTNLLPTFRKYFSLDISLTFLSYLTYLLSKNITEKESNYLIWSMNLVDALYQQFLLSRDDRVLETLRALSGKVELQIDCLNEIKMFMPILSRLQAGKDLVKKPGSSKTYTVERFQLYQ